MTGAGPDRATRLLLRLARDGRTVPFVARGDSMWPTIPSGSVLEIVPCPAEALSPGELAAVERDGWVVVHRVVSVGDGVARLRGDALALPDRDVPFAQVLGRARLVERRPLRLRWPRLAHVVRVLRATRRRLSV